MNKWFKKTWKGFKRYILPMNYTKNKSEILKIKNKYSKSMLKQYKLTGIGVGHKRIKEKPTDRICVVFMVEKKLPKSKVQKGQLLPSKLENVECDVIETGEIKALAVYDTKIRPAIGGYSVGHPNVTAGTLGCVVYKGATRYILSNNHVIADSNNATIGDDIYQPGVADGGVVADTVAQLDSFITLVDNVNVDCAIAEITDNNLVDDVGVWGGSIDNYTNPELYDVIYKTGRTTGTTQSVLYYEHTDVNVNYGSPLGVITITDCFITNSWGAVQGGDSGSVARINDNTAVGLVFASGGILNIFSYMSNIVTALSLDLPQVSHPMNLKYSLHSQGAFSPNTTVNANSKGGFGSGTLEWSNPDNAKVSDGNFATLGPFSGDNIWSRYLKASDFGFTIPDGAFIAEINVDIEFKISGSFANGGWSNFRGSIAMGDNGGDKNGWVLVYPWTGVLLGEGDWYIDNTELSYVTLNLMDFQWETSDVNSSNFAFYISEADFDGAIDITWFVDHIRVTVYYVTPTSLRTVTIDSGKTVTIRPNRTTTIRR